MLTQTIFFWEYLQTTTQVHKAITCDTSHFCIPKYNFKAVYKHWDHQCTTNGCAHRRQSYDKQRQVYDRQRQVCGTRRRQVYRTHRRQVYGTASRNNYLGISVT